MTMLCTVVGPMERVVAVLEANGMQEGEDLSTHVDEGVRESIHAHSS